MLSRMGLVMLVGKGLLGTRTGRRLVGRLGRGAAKTVLARLGKTATGAAWPDVGRSGGQGNGRRAGQGPQVGQALRTGGRPGGCNGHSGEELRDGLRDTVRDILSRPEATLPSSSRTLLVAAPSSSSVEDIGREAALSALAAHIVSFINGRVRLRHPALRQPEAHGPLREALGRQGCFTALTFSARTGSILLEYDGHRLSRADFCEAALPLGRFLASYDAVASA